MREGNIIVVVVKKRERSVWRDVKQAGTGGRHGKATDDFEKGKHDAINTLRATIILLGEEFTVESKTL